MCLLNILIGATALLPISISGAHVPRARLEARGDVENCEAILIALKSSAFCSSFVPIKDVTSTVTSRGSQATMMANCTGGKRKRQPITPTTTVIATTTKPTTTPATTMTTATASRPADDYSCADAFDCNAGDQGSSCGQSSDCVCTSDQNGVPFCTNADSAGGSCTNNADCGDEQRCAYNTCSGSICVTSTDTTYSNPQSARFLFVRRQPKRSTAFTIPDEDVA